MVEVDNAKAKLIDGRSEVNKRILENLMQIFNFFFEKKLFQNSILIFKQEAIEIAFRALIDLKEVFNIIKKIILEYILR